MGTKRVIFLIPVDPVASNPPKPPKKRKSSVRYGFEDFSLAQRGKVDEEMNDDEEELQRELLGWDGKVNWIISPIKNIPHNAVVMPLLGGEKDDTVISCSCGWAMRFPGDTRVKTAENVFVAHLGG